MNKIKDIIRENKYSFISAIVVFFAIAITYTLLRIQPFGKANIILNIDCFHQYSIFLVEFKEKLFSGESLLYSINSGLGMDFFGNIINYLLSPFNIIALILPKEAIASAISIIIMLKSMLSAFTFTYAVKKITNNKSILLIGYGCLYALSQYFVAYCWNIMWTDAIYMLPLVVLGIYKLITEDKRLLYIFALSFTIFTNYYMGFMVCIASVIFFLYFTLTENNFTTHIQTNETTKKKLNITPLFKKAITFALCSLNAGVMSAITIVPMICSLSNSSATKGTEIKDFFIFSPLNFLSTHFIFNSTTMYSNPPYGESLPNIFCGVFAICVLVIAYFSKKISKKEKVITTLITIFFILSFSVSQMNVVWHAFKTPNDIPHRFAYVYIFFILFISYKFLHSIEDIPKKKLVLLILSSFVIITVSCLYFAPNRTGLTFIVTLILSLLYLIMLSKGKITANKPISLILTLIIVLEATIPCVLGITAIKAEQYMKDTITMQETLDKIDDDSFYRIDLTYSTNVNQNGYSNYNSLSTFSSIQYPSTTLIHRHLGSYANKINYYNYVSQTPVYNLMFGLKYLVDTRENSDNLDSTYYDKLFTTSDGYPVYKNKYSTQIGFASKEDLAVDKVWNYNSFSALYNQSNFIKATTGVENVFENVPIELISTQNIDVKFDKNDKNQVFEYSITDNTKLDEVEIILKTDITEQGHYYAIMNTHNQMLFFNIEQTIDNKTYGLQEKPYSSIIDLGEISNGKTIETKITSSLTRKVNPNGTFSFFIYKLNDEAFEKGYDIIKENGILEVKDFSDNSYVTYINSKTDFIYTTIPYDTNWRIIANGKTLEYNKEIVSIADGLIGLRLPAGEYNIEFVYKNNIIIPSAITTALIFSITLIGEKMRKNNKKKKAEKT